MDVDRERNVLYQCFKIVKILIDVLHFFLICTVLHVWVPKGDSLAIKCVDFHQKNTLWHAAFGWNLASIVFLYFTLLYFKESHDYGLYSDTLLEMLYYDYGYFCAANHWRTHNHSEEGPSGAITRIMTILKRFPSTLCYFPIYCRNVHKWRGMGQYLNQPGIHGFKFLI